MRHGQRKCMRQLGDCRYQTLLAAFEPEDMVLRGGQQRQALLRRSAGAPDPSVTARWMS